MTEADSAKLFKLSAGKLDSKTFSAFGELYAAAQAYDGESFPVDCSELAFCGGNLAAALATLHVQLLTRHNKRGMNFLNLRPGVQSVLQDSGLFGTQRQKSRPTMMPLNRFQAGESARFDTYVKRGFTDKGLPKMSRGAEEMFFTGLHELFANFEIHSQSAAGAWACGQVFPSVGRFEFTIVDHGVGIPAKVMAMGFASTEASAIDWAMTGTNTTRELDVPGGLGLKLLREFIQLNGGQLTLASHRGFWRETQGRVDKRQLTQPFPGTAVTLVININDKQSYRLSTEINAGEIF